MARIGKAFVAVDECDARVAEIQQMFGGVPKGTNIINIQPGVGRFRLGSAMQDEGQVEPALMMDPSDSRGPEAARGGQWLTTGRPRRP